MTRLTWWLRKEFHEHRTALLFLGIALVVGSWLTIDLTDDPRAGVYLYEATGTPVGSGPTHPLNRSQWELLVVGGLALTVLVIAGGLVAGEARRGTLALMARTPGAWRTALTAKIVFLLLAAAASMLLQGLLLGALAEPHGLHSRGVPIHPTILLPRGEMLLGVWLVLGLGVWMLVASTALPLVGVPAFVGVVAGAAVLLPAIFRHVEYRYLLRWWLGDPAWYVLLWALAALALLAWGWTRMLRYGRSAPHAALRFLAVAGALAGLSTVVLASTSDRYRTFDAHAADLRIAEVRMGAGGRFAYLQVHRGDPRSDAGDMVPVHLLSGTPAHAWCVDLTDGSWTELGGEHSRFGHTEAFGWNTSRRLGEDSLLTLAEHRSAGRRWVDGLRGEVFASTAFGDPPPEALTRLRDGLRASTRVRDSQGRAAWVLQGRLERDGVEPVRLSALRQGLNLHEVPGGWGIYLERAWEWEGDGARFHRAQTIDAEDGRVRTTPEPMDGDEERAAVRAFLDPRHALISKIGHGENLPMLRDFRVLDLDSGTDEALLGASSSAMELRPLAILSRSEALAVTSSAGAVAVAHVTLPSGEMRVLPWEGEALQGVQRVFWAVGRSGSMVAFPGQKLCLSCLRTDPALLHRVFRRDEGDLRTLLQDETREEDVSGWLEALVVYDPATRALRVLRTWAPTLTSPAFHMRSDGSLLIAEASRRIVRLGPEPGQREVLFPRR